MASLKKVAIQVGHGNVTTGATGAPGERDWNSKIVPMVAEILRNRDIEVYETDAVANEDYTVLTTDWDLFLAVHYDADIYNDRGGFTDYPEPSTDHVTAKSQKMALGIAEHFFGETKIPQKPKRSNANTRYYYMWRALSANTPCVLIECGVGWRKPEDYETLRKYDFIAKTLADAICKVLDVSIDDSGGKKFTLKDDIPTEIEEEYNLKKIKRYDKYWSFGDLIEDWIKIIDEIDALDKKLKKLEDLMQEQAKDLNDKIDNRDITIAKINKAFEQEKEGWDIKEKEYINTNDNLVADLAELKEKNKELKEALGSNGYQLIVLGVSKMLEGGKEKIKALFRR